VQAKTKLSKREKQIVRLVAEGYSSKVIADQLFISFHTVNTHRKNIICKTHSKNTSGLVQYAISNRVIENFIAAKEGFKVSGSALLLLYGLFLCCRNLSGSNFFYLPQFFHQ